MNLSSDQVNLIALIISLLSATFAGYALVRSAQEQKANVKEDFLLWAMERLRKDDLRDFRGQIYCLTEKQLAEAAQVARNREKNQTLDAIREVALSFDEIGYFVYKMQIVEFRTILDMYSQTVKIWNKVAPVIQAWREIEGNTSFIYFEMLARQERLKAEPHFEPATKLYPNRPSVKSRDPQGDRQSSNA